MKRSMIGILLILLIYFCQAEQINVVGEIFTASWWGYCPDARTGIRQLDQNQDNVIALLWQSPSGYVSEPSPNYYNRSSFYGVGGLPHAEFGGYISVVGGGVPMYSYYLNAYNQIINTDSPLHIEIEFTDHDADNNIVNAEIEILEDLVTSNNKIVFIV